MKKLAIVLLIGSTCLIYPSEHSMHKSIFDYNVRNIIGEEVSLSTFKGKKILIVNVASNCGYTSQYKDLQKLQDKYEKKLQIIAFPCNDFGSQEPGSNVEIAEFCEYNYGVRFPVMSKINIRKNPIHPLYQWLTNSNLNGWNNASPRWNFFKFLIDEEGNLINIFGSGTNPLSSEIIDAL